MDSSSNISRLLIGIIVGCLIGYLTVRHRRLSHNAILTNNDVIATSASPKNIHSSLPPPVQNHTSSLSSPVNYLAKIKLTQTANQTHAVLQNQSTVAPSKSSINSITSINADIPAKPMKQYKLTVPAIKYFHRHPSNMSDDLLLFYYAVRNIENDSDLVYINGPRGKRLFDIHNANPHLLINDRLNIRDWYQLATMINETVQHSIPLTKAV